MTKESPRISETPADLNDTGKQLVLHNDEVNSFEFVIDTLIEVCGHEPEQAEQCTMIAHTKGRCGVKTGDPILLETMHNEMNIKGLTTTIE